VAIVPVKYLHWSLSDDNHECISFVVAIRVINSENAAILLNPAHFFFFRTSKILQHGLTFYQVFPSSLSHITLPQGSFVFCLYNENAQKTIENGFNADLK